MMSIAMIESEGSASVLSQADDLINGEREERYGDPKVNLGRIAKLWSIITKTDITPEQVCLMMVALKMSRRLTGSENPDDLVDMAGYIGLIERLNE